MFAKYRDDIWDAELGGFLHHQIKIIFFQQRRTQPNIFARRNIGCPVFFQNLYRRAEVAHWRNQTQKIRASAVKKHDLRADIVAENIFPLMHQIAVGDVKLVLRDGCLNEESVKSHIQNYTTFFKNCIKNIFCYTQTNFNI